MTSHETLELGLPFRPGENWTITNIFNDPATRELYQEFEQEGHEGIDWGCCTGTPIHAMAAGYVHKALRDPGNNYGNYITIRTAREDDASGGFELAYAHLSVLLVEKGQEGVKQGDLIGVSGRTNTDVSHLHVRYRTYNKEGVVGIGDDFNGGRDFKNFLVGHPYNWDAITNDTSGIPQAINRHCLNSNISPGSCPEVQVKAGTTVHVYSKPYDNTDEHRLDKLAPGTYALVGHDGRYMPAHSQRDHVGPPGIRYERRWWQIERSKEEVGWVRMNQVTVTGDTGTRVSTLRDPRLIADPEALAGADMDRIVSAVLSAEATDVSTPLPVRSGPSTVHAEVGRLADRTVYPIVGKDAETPAWWQIQYRTAMPGWVSRNFVVTSGTLSKVPTVQVEQPTPPGPEMPTPPPGGVQRASGRYLNLATNWEGRWAVSKRDTTVTASFGSVRSPVQYYARQRPEDLFVLPAGFRPTAPVQHTVPDGRHVNTDGTDHVSGLPARFDLTVGQDGAVRYLNDHQVDHVGYLAYQVTGLEWQTAAALATPISQPDLNRQGHFQNRAVHWEGRYDLTRRGNTVTGTLGSTRSAVQYAARQNPANLCVLPAELRPARQYRHTVPDGRRVNTDGTDHVSGLPARFDLTVGQDGAVRYVDGPELDHVGYLRYTARVRWTAAARVQPPAAPENLQAEGLEATTATLDWSRPVHNGGARIEGYRLERWTGSVWRALVQDTGSTRTRHMLTGLAAATVYLLRVRALNAAGAGVPSGVVQVATSAAPLPPPGQPRDLTAEAVGPHVQLRWRAPAGGGPVHGYRVWRRVGTSGSWVRHVPDTGETLTQWRDRHDLAPATAYAYAVQGHHAAAAGIRSAPVSVVTAAASPGVVGAGTVHLYGGRVALTWTVPAADGGRPVTHYRVRRRLASENQAYALRAVRVPDTAYDEAAPTVDGTWYYSIQAVNALGDSPWSNPETSGHVLQVGTPPSAVDAGTVRLAGGQVTLTWTAPTHDGGRPVTHYRVRRRLASQNQAYALRAERVQDTAYVEAAPTVDGTWYYSVQAVNALGDSLWSNPETSGHVLQVGTSPAAVGAGTVRLAGGQVTLTWTAPTHDGGRPVTHYRVRRRLASRNQPYALRTERVQDTSYVEAAPTVDGTWYYSVQAVNALGAGPWSNPEPGGHVLILPA